MNFFWSCMERLSPFSFLPRPSFLHFLFSFSLSLFLFPSLLFPSLLLSLLFSPSSPVSLLSRNLPKPFPLVTGCPSVYCYLGYVFSLLSPCSFVSFVLFHASLHSFSLHISHITLQLRSIYKNTKQKPIHHNHPVQTDTHLCI